MDNGKSNYQFKYGDYKDKLTKVSGANLFICYYLD